MGIGYNRLCLNMLSQEEIYDLDTSSLRNRIAALKINISLSPHSDKLKLGRVLELAELEIEEREAMEMCELFESNINSYQFLYLNVHQS